MSRKPEHICFQDGNADGQKKHEKILNITFILREMKIKTTMRHHLTLVTTAIIKKHTSNKRWEGYREKRTLYNVHFPGGNVNWCSHCGKHYGGFSKY